MPKLKRSGKKVTIKKLTPIWSQSIEDYVIDLSWSPEGSLLAAAETSGPITILDAEQGVSRQSNVDQSCNFLRDSYLPYLVILLPVEL